eukprot:7936131-Prorocentrum_lima.AAC.1
MTSSLVGSEMCIRDSSATTLILEACSPKSWPALVKALAKESGPTKSVSYTHLTLPTICSV